MFTVYQEDTPRAPVAQLGLATYGSIMRQHGLHVRSINTHIDITGRQAM